MSWSRGQEGQGRFGWMMPSVGGGGRAGRVVCCCALVLLVGACAADARPSEAGASESGSGRWSDPQTWGGRLPVKGDRVSIPEGATVVLDASTPALEGLQIQGRLLFEDGRDVRLTADWIVVHGQGALLQVGTETEPFRHNAVITLTGTDESENVMGAGPLAAGTKVLGIMHGGTLELHGDSRDRVSWTQLDGHARPGDGSLVLAEPVDWERGDRIVVAPSGFDPSEAEEVTVTAVVGRVVGISPPLEHPHWGTLQTYAGRTLDERAEVGLLTRNVRVRGAADSLASEFGGHVMVMTGGTAHVEGVEFHRMGQEGHAARYPLHWHLVDRLGDGTVVGEGQWARNNSVHQSFNRAIAIHGTSGVELDGNVAYDIGGHGFVVAEDGDEQRNIVTRNLGVGIRALTPEEFSFPMEGDDDQNEDRPGVFWMRNPNHTFRGNHAAGSTGNGFFFEAVPDPDEDDDEEPAVALDAFAFAGNVAHSNWHGRFRAGGGPAITNGHGLLLLGALEGELDEGDAVVQDYTGYMNSNSGAWLESGREHLVGGVLADNVAAVQAEPGPVLRDLVVVGRSRNGIGEDLVDSEGVPGAQRQAQGVLFDDDMARTFRLEDSTLIGLGDGVIVLEDTFTFPDGRGGRTRGLTLIDSAPFDASEAIFAGTGAIVDSDGTLTGNGPGARLPAPEEAPT